jgi:hypothetical protein
MATKRFALRLPAEWPIENASYGPGAAELEAGAALSSSPRAVVEGEECTFCIKVI